MYRLAGGINPAYHLSCLGLVNIQFGLSATCLGGISWYSRMPGSEFLLGNNSSRSGFAIWRRMEAMDCRKKRYLRDHVACVPLKSANLTFAPNYFFQE